MEQEHSVLRIPRYLHYATYLIRDQRDSTAILSFTFTKQKCVFEKLTTPMSIQYVTEMLKLIVGFLKILPLWSYFRYVLQRGRYDTLYI